jgi:hypothetical protein
MARISQRPRRSSPLYLTSALELFLDSSGRVWRNKWIFGPLYIFPFIFAFHAWVWTPAPDNHQGRAWWTDYSWFGSGFSSSIPTYVWYTVVGFSLLWLLTVAIAGTITQIMVQEAQLDAAKGREQINFSGLWKVVKEIGWRMFGLYLLIGIYILAPLAVWLVLFMLLGGSAVIFAPIIIISLIMLRRYFLAPYLVLDKRLDITQAMDTSAEITKAYSWSVWSIIGVMVVIGLANLIPGIGWLIAFAGGCLYSLAPALRYQELKKLFD